MSAESQAGAAEISRAEGPKPHVPIQAVTIDSLRLNHLSLSRLLDDVAKRLRDMLAAKHGVALGDTVEYPESKPIGGRWQMEVTSLSMAIERVGPEAETPGNVVLIVRGAMADCNGAEATIHWNPETCRVVKKGDAA